MSLRDGSMKMSKSDPSDMSRINLTDDDDIIAQKIRKARTDPEPLPEDPALLAARPEARNLVGVLAALGNESEAAVCARFSGQGFGAFKPALTEALVALLSPIRARLFELRRDEAQIDAFLAAGAGRAAALAAPTIAGAYRAVGLRA
jgi:tryptophanyl-tRNA synthetase